MRPARRYGVGPLRTSSLLGTSRFRKCQFTGMILSRFRRSEGVIRRFVAEHLAPPAGGLAVAALDETGQEKKGSATAGVKRQYMGCAGQVANGVNTVHCSYATRGGHALVGARLYLPAEQLDDPDRRTALGIPTDVVFRTKP